MPSIRAQIAASIAPTKSRLTTQHFRHSRGTIGGIIYPPAVSVRRRYAQNYYGVWSSWLSSLFAGLPVMQHVNYAGSYDDPPNPADFTMAGFKGVFLGPAARPFLQNAPTESWETFIMDPGSGFDGSLIVGAPGGDFVRRGGGAVIVGVTNARVTYFAGSLNNTVSTMVGTMPFNTVPFSNFQGPVVPSPNVAHIAGEVVRGVFRDTEPPAANAVVIAGDHPVLDGPYGNVNSVASWALNPNLGTVHTGYARMIITGPGAVGLIQATGAGVGVLGGTDFGSVYVCIAEELGLGRVVYIAAEPLIFPYNDAAKALLQNAIAWATRTNPIPAEPVL